MGIAIAIAELLSLGAQQWVVEPGEGAPSHRGAAGCLGANEWDELSCRVVMSALEELTGIAVASGAVGAWLHGYTSRHPASELRLIGIGRDDGSVWDGLSAHAARADWSVETASPTDAYLVGPASAVRVHLLHPALPDEAFDGPLGYQRGALADWALAVEALAMIAMPREGEAVDEALGRLRFLLGQIPDVLWTHALRNLSPTARASWLAGPYARSVPELREVAAAIPWEGMVS